MDGWRGEREKNRIEKDPFSCIVPPGLVNVFSDEHATNIIPKRRHTKFSETVSNVFLFSVFEQRTPPKHGAKERENSSERGVEW